MWYGSTMALNIKDSEAERLAAEVATMTGDSKTGAIRESLRIRRDQLAARASFEQRRARLKRLMEEEIWPQIPPDLLGKKVTKEEREEILGYGPDGV
jgi:antitoxin VapB